MKNMCVVTNNKFVNILKTSKRFVKNLGIASTHFNNSGYRSLYDKDKFLYYYTKTYKRLIMAQGNIDFIKIYLDYYINDDILLIYHNDVEYKHVVDYNVLKDIGIDNYINQIVNDINEMNDKNAKKINVDDNFKPDADRVIKDPGNVRFDDLMDYLKKYNSERYKI